MDCCVISEGVTEDVDITWSSPGAAGPVFIVAAGEGGWQPSPRALPVSQGSDTEGCPRGGTVSSGVPAVPALLSCLSQGG